jgi:hypothetical protein
MSRVFGAACFLSLLFATLPAHAQTASVDPFTLDSSPQYPTPYQTITITPSSTLFDMGSAVISATVNGKSFYKGSGGASINVPIGGPGTVTNISVSAVSGGQTYTKKLTFRPASVALVVEPVSTTHPFYAGASLVPSEGSVRLVAIPDLRTSAGKAIDPATLEYTWKLGDQQLDSNSGIGQSVLTATAPQRYRDAIVSVVVQSQDGSLVAEADTTISPVDQASQVYIDDPLLGPLYDTALSDTYTMPNTEDTFLGIPYYFSGTPGLGWVMNGTNSGSDADITVRSTGNGTGTAGLTFSANNSDSSESANSTVSVLFGKKSSIGIFGL